MNWEEHKGVKKYKILRSNLDSKGFVTHINRVNEKCFNLIINGEIVKVYKKRQSANNYLIKLFKKL